MEKLRVGVIGLGCRGYSLLKDVMLHRMDVEITAVCDEYKDRAQAAAELTKDMTGKKASYHGRCPGGTGQQSG